MREEKLANYYPIFLAISAKKCVVVGGGEVALRKVKALLECGASIEVISPELCPELNHLAEMGAIQIQPRGYQEGDLQGAVIVIAATNNKKTNLEVMKEASRKAILVNVVDDPQHSGFIVPSYLRRGDFTIAISTAGRSPALARRIRLRLEEEFGDEYASLALLVGEVRDEVKRRGIKISGHAWQEALDLDLLIELLKKGEREKVKVKLLSNLKKGHRLD